MSEENRPNLNAVGLLVDIQNSIQKRIRGNAANAPQADILVLAHKLFLPVIEQFDAELDKTYGPN